MPLLVFASPKGGVGKTTLAAHVAALLAARGIAVLALDLDPQNALRLHLGLGLRDEGGFCGWLDQAPSWRAALRESASGVRLLPHGQVDALRALTLQGALLAAPELLTGPVRDMLADPRLLVVVDSPPGASAALLALLPMADLVVQVLLADAGSAAMLPALATQGRGTLAKGSANGAARAGRGGDRMVVALNQVDLDQPLGEAVMAAAEATLGGRLLGAVCRDPALAEALADRRLLLAGEAGAGEDLALLAVAIATRLRLDQPSAARQAGFSALADWGLTEAGAPVPPTPVPPMPAPPRATRERARSPR